MESLLQLVHVDPALLAKIFPIVVLSMGILSGIAVSLKAVASFTSTKADDAAASFLDKAIAIGQKIVDFLSGNIQH
jgi:hypothetical protein